MKKTETFPYDVVDYLTTPEDCAGYFDACIQESDGDAAFIARALGEIARAKGFTRIANNAGLSCESLREALSGDRNPDFTTILKVIRAVGIKLHATLA